MKPSQIELAFAASVASIDCIVLTIFDAGVMRFLDSFQWFNSVLEEPLVQVGSVLLIAALVFGCIGIALSHSWRKSAVKDDYSTMNLKSDDKLSIVALGLSYASAGSVVTGLAMSLIAIIQFVVGLIVILFG